MKASIDPVMDEIQEASSQVFAMKRLTHLNDVIDKARENLTAIENYDGEKPQDIKPRVDEAEDRGRNAKDRADQIGRDMKLTAQRNLRLAENASIESLRDIVQPTHDMVNETVRGVMKLAEGLGSNPDVLAREQQYIIHGESLLKSLNDIDFGSDSEKALQELDLARYQREKSAEFEAPSLEIGEKIKTKREEHRKVEEALRELQKLSEDAERKGEEVQRSVERMNANEIRAVAERINDFAVETRKVLDEANDRQNSTDESLRFVRDALIQLPEDYDRLARSSEPLKANRDALEVEFPKLKESVLDARMHANSLMLQTRDLENTFADTRQRSQNAMFAVESNQQIADNIMNATEASRLAVQGIQKLQPELGSLVQEVKLARNESAMRVLEADQINRKIESNLVTSLNLRKRDIEGIENGSLPGIHFDA